MALSSNSTWLGLVIDVVTPAGPKSAIVKTSSVAYHGSLMSHDTVTGAVHPFDGTQANRIIGWHFGDTVTGLTTAAVPPRAKITPGGFRVRNLTVAGLVGDASDYGRPVYATDDGTYTITDPGSGQKLGRVEADSNRASGKATVHFLLVGMGV